MQEYENQRTFEMRQRTSFNIRLLLLLASSLAIACSKGEGMGCGSAARSTSSTSDETPRKVVSDLAGVYRITGHEQSLGTCDQLVDLPGASNYLVLYRFEPDDGSATRLGGTFCSDGNHCRTIAKRAAEPGVGYSFVAGDDAAGWQGWAIVETGSLEDKCAATVQVHALSALTPKKLQIETKTVEVFFVPASEEDGVATCSNKQAIAVATNAESCSSRLVLQATREPNH